LKGDHGWTAEDADELTYTRERLHALRLHICTFKSSRSIPCRATSPSPQKNFLKIFVPTHPQTWHNLIGTNNHLFLLPSGFASLLRSLLFFYVLQSPFVFSAFRAFGISR
jgi:hypothetical protein